MWYPAKCHLDNFTSNSQLLLRNLRFILITAGQRVVSPYFSWHQRFMCHLLEERLLLFLRIR
jgi:hypothetical protein